MANPRQALGSRGPGSTRLPSSMTPTASVGVISSACRNGSGSCTYRTCIGGGFIFWIRRSAAITSLRAYLRHREPDQAHYSAASS